MGDQQHGIDVVLLDRLANDIAAAAKTGAQIGLVLGGGNLFRGAALAEAGMDRVTGDQMGMLATVMNALAMRDALERAGARAEVMSAVPIGTFTVTFNRREAMRRLAGGEVLLFAAGTGNPFFTTDTGATLRAIEIGAELLVKATKVDGVYSADPMRDPNATRYEHLSFREAIERQLGVLDAAALLLCRDHNLSLRVCNIFEPGVLQRLAAGEAVGSLVTNND